MNLAYYRNLMNCTLDELGILTQVTFMRIDKVNSEPADDFYNERDIEEKIYINFTFGAQVEEKPRRNVYGPGGGEVIADVAVTWYGSKGATADNDYTAYIPDYPDLINWRGTKYEVTEIERIQPFGENDQLGWRVLGTRFS